MYIVLMNTISVSKLKENPANAVYQATSYPLAIQSRNKVKAYLIGKDLYESLVKYIENYIDSVAAANADLSKGRDFEDIAKELGI